MEITDNKTTLKKIRKILFDNGVRYGVYDNEQGLTVFIDSMILDNVIEKFEEWFGEFDVKIYKSKSEEITIKVCG
jgi:hypothetical protein